MPVLLVDAINRLCHEGYAMEAMVILEACLTFIST
jgi:hypothetical protein